MFRSTTLICLFSYLALASAQGTYIGTDIEAYAVTKTDLPIPEPTEVYIDVQDDGGVNFLFGTDVDAASQEAFDTNCGDGLAAENCFNSVADAVGYGLSQEDTGLSKRLSPRMAPAVVGGAIAVVVKIWMMAIGGMSATDRVYLSPEQKETFDAIKSENSYIAMTASDDPSPITIVVTPVPVPDPTLLPSATIEGTDWVAAYPTDMPDIIASVTDEVICERSIRARRINARDEPPAEACVRSMAERISLEMQGGGFLSSVQQLEAWPVIPNAFEGVVEAVVEFIGEFGSFIPGNEEPAARFATFSAWAKLQPNGLSTVVKVPASELTESDDDDDEEQTEVEIITPRIHPFLEISDEDFDAAVQMRLYAVENQPSWLSAITGGTSDGQPITDGSDGGTCGAGASTGDVGMFSNTIDWSTLQDCLVNLDTSQWLDTAVGQQSNCQDMVQFESASKSWDSPSDCYNACKNCLSQSIDDGNNQMWCDAWAGAAHCWMGYTIPNPDPITSGSSGSNTEQRIDAYGTQGRDGKFVDKYALQTFLGEMDPEVWHAGEGALDFEGTLSIGKDGSNWNSPADCYNALINCVSDAVNKGASKAWCDAYSGFAHCWMGFDY